MTTKSAGILWHGQNLFIESTCNDVRDEINIKTLQKKLEVTLLTCEEIERDLDQALRPDKDPVKPVMIMTHYIAVGIMGFVVGWIGGYTYRGQKQIQPSYPSQRTASIERVQGDGQGR